MNKRGPFRVPIMSNDSRPESLGASARTKKTLPHDLRDSACLLLGLLCGVQAYACRLCQDTIKGILVPWAAASSPKQAMVSRRQPEKCQADLAYSYVTLAGPVEVLAAHEAAGSRPDAVGEGHARLPLTRSQGVPGWGRVNFCRNLQKRSCKPAQLLQHSRGEQSVICSGATSTPQSNPPVNQCFD